MCFCLSQIQYPPSPVPGVPLENSFQILDDFGTKCGSASVIEFINHTMLPDRPLNYYLSISAQDSRSLHLLIGACYTRTLELRRKNAQLPARMYARCNPQDQNLLAELLDCGFENDDAIVRKRLILAETDRMPKPPVSTSIAPVLLETQEDYDALLRRINAYSVTAYNYNWIARMQAQPHFSAWGVWQEDHLLGELVLTANGSEGVVEMLYSKPEFRHRGVASALIGQATQELLRNGVRALIADVWQRNEPATQLFEKMHFETTQPVRLYPGINL